jgi:hypothetical protein
VTKGYLVKVGEFWATVDAEGDDTFRVRIDERSLAADRKSFDEAVAYFRRAYASGSELDQVFAAKPGVVVTGLHSSDDDQVLELELERVSLSDDR